MQKIEIDDIFKENKSIIEDLIVLPEQCKVRIKIQRSRKFPNNHGFGIQVLNGYYK